MQHEIVIPKMGDSVMEVTILKFRKKIGDKVGIEEPVFDIATDKVDSEIPSDKAGMVTQILFAENDVVPVGATVMFIEVADEAFAASTPPLTTEPRANPLPMLPADEVEPTTAPVPVSINPVKTASSGPNTSQFRRNGSRRCTPLAREAAKILSVNLHDIQSDAPYITLKDILKKHLEQSKVFKMGAPTSNVENLPDFAQFGKVRREKMDTIAKATAKNTYQSWTTIPHAWVMEKTDLTALEALRQTHKEAIKKMGGSLSITVIVAKAVARLLRQFPNVNASIETTSMECIYKDFVHLSIAVDTPHGLLMPVIQDCDRKSISEIGIELVKFSNLAREKKLTPTDMDGGTFTISNVGSFGGTGIIPIVPNHQAAILGLTSAQIEMVWNPEKKIAEPRPLMQMTIGFDHRLVNGAEATRFLMRLKEMLEQPELILIF